MSPGEFDVGVEAIAGASVVHVLGELDLSTAPLLEDALEDVSADRVVVDLMLCTFLDSAGVRVLANCMRDQAPEGKSMAIVAADPGILRVLEITGLDAMVSVHPSVEDAL